MATTENRLVRAQELYAPTNRAPYTVTYAYLWDGWNIIRETSTDFELQTSNFELPSNSQTLTPSNSQTDYAHYDYSPFGEILVQSGPLADTFTHRFSTKPWCPVTGLYEYQMRKYRPEIGRWISRDPIGEKMQKQLEMSSQARALHGLYFWGHGNEEGVGSSNSMQIWWGSLKLNYKIGLGLIFACYGNRGQNALSSRTTGSIWYGYDGVLYPICPRVYHVKSFIRHGMQGAK